MIARNACIVRESVRDESLIVNCSGESKSILLVA